jgi:hypothetical protein
MNRMAMGAIQRWCRIALVFTLLAAVLNPQPIMAQSHVVSQDELRAALQNVAQMREKNRIVVTSLLTSPQAEKALKAAHLNANAVHAAVSELTDDELTRLADRAQQIQNDIVAGRISDRDLLLILLGIVALVLIIVAVR